MRRKGFFPAKATIQVFIPAKKPADFGTHVSFTGRQLNYLIEEWRKYRNPCNADITEAAGKVVKRNQHRWWCKATKPNLIVKHLRRRGAKP